MMFGDAKEGGINEYPRGAKIFGGDYRMRYSECLITDVVPTIQLRVNSE